MTGEGVFDFGSEFETRAKRPESDIDGHDVRWFTVLDARWNDSSSLPALPANWQPEVLAFTGEKLDIVIDQERVEEVLDTLLDAYDKKAFPYNLDSVRLPHDARHMPPSMEVGSKAHAMFLWNSCYYMRGGIKSVDAFKRLGMVYEQRPDLFDCEVAAKTNPEEIAALLKQNGLGFQKTVSTHWVINAQRLQQQFDGDPRKIFEQTETYEDCLAVIKNRGKDSGFLGFQEKMTSMIIYYLMDENLIEPFNFPIPVDLHVMRISIANKMITFPNAPHGTNLCTDETLATLRKIYFDYAVENNVNPLRLCDAVWLLSESLCGRYPGNVTMEPLGRKHRNGRATILIPLEVDTSSPAQQAAYEASCRHCPVQPSCEYAIPGKQYYVGGSVIIRGKRVRFPTPNQEPLFNIS